MAITTTKADQVERESVFVAVGKVVLCLFDQRLQADESAKSLCRFVAIAYPDVLMSEWIILEMVMRAIGVVVRGEADARRHLFDNRCEDVIACS